MRAGYVAFKWLEARAAAKHRAIQRAAPHNRMIQPPNSVELTQRNLDLEVLLT